jgi:hypothetical protein
MIENCIKGWAWRNRSQFADKKANVSGIVSNVSALSPGGKDNANPEVVSVSAIVSIVSGILAKGLDDWEEQQELTKVQENSELKVKPFWQLVSKLRSQFDDIQPEDRARLERLINSHHQSIDWDYVLPDLAPYLTHDARSLGIDPVAIWQYLLPAVLSLVGKKASLDLTTHSIPAIAWCCTVSESGTGKTRAEKLVMSPLKAIQEVESKRFKEDLDKYSADLKAGEDPLKPRPERKYLFQVATIQAVMRRLAEQSDNGTVWSRDEIAGLFKSLDQFSGGKDSESLECLLELWDGNSIQVDRVSVEESYFIPSTRLSVSGGIQPAVYRRIFRDPDDAQGMAARFLFAIQKESSTKRTKGIQYLNSILPELYQSIDQLSEIGSIRLSRAADERYDAIYEQINEEAKQCSHAGVRAWLRKLPGQIARIALGLHIIECAFNPGKRTETLTIETLERAIAFGRYYQASFEWLQEQASEGEEVSSLLTQIWERGLSPNGVTAREIYKGRSKLIGRNAKLLSRDISSYVVDLFHRLAEMGKGRIEHKGRSVRYYSEPTSTTPQNGLNPETTETIAETQTEQAFELSTRPGDTPETVETIAETNGRKPSVNPQDAINRLLSARRSFTRQPQNSEQEGEVAATPSDLPEPTTDWGF